MNGKLKLHEKMIQHTSYGEETVEDTVRGITE